jgi:hypothetical protein
VRLVSFDDTEAGVFAFGAMPVGIVAIGGMPVGVVAIGGAAFGGAAVACGGAAGLVVVTCGVGAGGFTACVGLGIGLRTAVMGLGLDVLGTRSRVDESEPGPSRFDLRVRDEAVALERLTTGELSAGWILLEATRGPAKTWALVAAGAPVELTDPKVERQLAKLGARDRRVLAHVVAEERVDPNAVSSDYRSAQPTRRVLRCDQLMTTGKEPGPAQERTSTIVDWLGALWKGPILLAALALALWGVCERVLDLELDQKGEISFGARVVRAQGQGPAVGQECEVRVWLRTDGGARQKAAVEVTCGGSVLYPRPQDQRARVDEVPAAGGGAPFRYRLRYVDGGSKPGHDDSGRAGLTLDTGARRATLETWDDHAYRVELAVDELSAERVGAPLVGADRAR